MGACGVDVGVTTIKLSPDGAGWENGPNEGTDGDLRSAVETK